MVCWSFRVLPSCLSSCSPPLRSAPVAIMTIVLLAKMSSSLSYFIRHLVIVDMLRLWILVLYVMGRDSWTRLTLMSWEGTPGRSSLLSWEGTLGRGSLSCTIFIVLTPSPFSLLFSLSLSSPYSTYTLRPNPKAIYSFVPVCVLVASTKYWPKSNMGRRQFIWLAGYSPRSKEAKAGTRMQAVKQRHGGYLLPGLLSVVCSACILRNQGSLVQGWHHPQWASFHRNH